MNRQSRRHSERLKRTSAPTGGHPAGIATSLVAAARYRLNGQPDKAERIYRDILALDPKQPTALNWLGALLHVRGDNERALDLLTQAARLHPDEPLCLYHLAEVQRATGRYAEAVASYRRAPAMRLAAANLHFGLGTALLELGRAEEAAAELSRAVALAPDDAEARNNLGNALAECQQHDDAEAHYRTALRLHPAYADAHLNLGLALAQRGETPAAILSFRAALESDPDLDEACRQLARHMRAQGQSQDALALLHNLAGRRPDSPAAARELGHAYRDLGRYESAEEWYRKAIDLQPEHAATYVDLGHCLSRLGRYDAALGEFRRALDRCPDLAEAHFNIGVSLQSVGRFDEAVAAHERALALRPDLTEAHYNLAMIARQRGHAAQIDRLQTLLTRPDLTDDARVNAHFALAKHHDAAGDVDAAFTQYQAGNDIKARKATFDPGRHVGYIDRSIAVFDRAFFAARSGYGDAIQRPVFIVGMPRSGTTLVEQILSSHPAVTGAGELDDIRRLVEDLPRRLGTTASYPECAGALDRATSRDLAQYYLATLDDRFPASPRLTDKMTGNYLRLGLISLLLPRAAIIHCRRDALDTCLSCYVQNFATGLTFTYDLANLGLVYRQHERLMAHWRAVLPSPILDVRYEDLVADPEAVSRAIVDFCDLPWDARCLNFDQNERQVRTASFWQVRQPIYASSVGRWRNFSRHLGPLFEALDMAEGGPT